MTDDTTHDDTAENIDTDHTTTATDENSTDEADGETVEPETFTREYVEKLRTEAAEHRVKAKDRDDLAQQLHTALVAATGRLADPTDLTYDENHLNDSEALTAAIDDLLDRKPHLAARRLTGDVGQGVGGTGDNVDLAGILRSRAG